MKGSCGDSRFQAFLAAHPTIVLRTYDKDKQHDRQAEVSLHNSCRKMRRLIPELRQHRRPASCGSRSA